MRERLRCVAGGRHGDGERRARRELRPPVDRVALTRTIDSLRTTFMSTFLER